MLVDIAIIKDISSSFMSNAFLEGLVDIGVCIISMRIVMDIGNVLLDFLKFNHVFLNFDIALPILLMLSIVVLGNRYIVSILLGKGKDLTCIWR